MSENTADGLKLRYTPQAIADLQRLHDFLAFKNPLVARKAAIELQEAANKLKVFPKIGLPVRNCSNSDLIRDLYVGNYTIRYQVVSSEAINVLRLWHNKEVEKDF